MALNEHGVPRSNKYVDQTPQGDKNGTNGTAKDYSMVPSNGPAGCELRTPSLGSLIARLALADSDNFTGDGHSILTRSDAILHDRSKPRINPRRSRSSQEVRMRPECSTRHEHTVCISNNIDLPGSPT